MTEYKQKQLREMVAYGIAKDVTNATTKNCKELVPESYRQVGYSAGVYGCNGMLLLGESGQLYAVTARTIAVYLF